MFHKMALVVDEDNQPFILEGESVIPLNDELYYIDLKEIITIDRFENIIGHNSSNPSVVDDELEVDDELDTPLTNLSREGLFGIWGRLFCKISSFNV